MDNLQKIKKSLKRRSRAEKRFRWYGRTAICCLTAVLLLFVDIVSKGHGAFKATYIQLDIYFDGEQLGVSSLADPSELMQANWDALPKVALRNQFTDVKSRRDKRKLYGLISNGAGFDLKDHLLANPLLLNQTETLWILADDDIDTYYKSWLDGEPYAARLSKKQVNWIEELHQQGKIALQFNSNLFTRGDSREPEQAGIRGAVIGSMLTLLITLLLSFPIGVAAAVLFGRIRTEETNLLILLRLILIIWPLCPQLFLVCWA